jgi:hypothetical protein
VFGRYDVVADVSLPQLLGGLIHHSHSPQPENIGKSIDNSFKKSIDVTYKLIAR